MKTILLATLLTATCPEIPQMNDSYNLSSYRRSCQETASLGDAFPSCIEQMVRFGVDPNSLTATKWIAICRNITLKKANGQFNQGLEVLLGSGLRPNGVNALTWVSILEPSSLNSEVEELNLCFGNFLNSKIDHDGTNGFKWINGCRVASHFKKSAPFNHCVNDAASMATSLEDNEMYVAIENCLEKLTN